MQSKPKELDQDGFATLTKSAFKVRNFVNGIHEHVSVVFSDYLYSYVDCNIHSTTMSRALSD
jgi:hypothetical protein